MSAISWVVETDRWVFGGYHWVVAYGNPLDRMVYGWFNAHHDVGTVVANGVTFQVQREVIDSAQEALQSGRAGELPAAAQKPVT